MLLSTSVVVIFLVSDNFTLVIILPLRTIYYDHSNIDHWLLLVMFHGCYLYIIPSVIIYNVIVIVISAVIFTIVIKTSILVAIPCLLHLIIYMYIVYTLYCCYYHYCNWKYTVIVVYNHMLLLFTIKICCFVYILAISRLIQVAIFVPEYGHSLSI